MDHPQALAGRDPAYHPGRYAPILITEEGRSSIRPFLHENITSLLPQVGELDFQSIIGVLASPGTATGWSSFGCPKMTIFWYQNAAKKAQNG